MGRFRNSDAPRVVGFDFGPPVPAPVPPAEPAAAPVAAPVAEAAPSYPTPAWPPPAPAAPPAYSPPAYSPPAYAAPAAEQQPYAFSAPVATVPDAEPWSVPLRGQFPPPPSWTPPAPATKRRGVHVSKGTIGLGGLLLVGGRIAWRIYAGTAAANPLGLTLSTPQLVGGLPQLRLAELDAATREIKNDMASSQQPQVAYYGTDDPTYVLIAGLGAEKDATDTMRVLTKSFGKDGTVGPHNAMPGDLVCAPLITDGERAGVCTWGGRGSDGAVIKFGPLNLPALAKVTAATRSSVEGR